MEPVRRLRDIQDQLRDIGGGRSLGFGANRVRSLPDGLAQVLAEYLEEREERCLSKVKAFNRKKRPKKIHDEWQPTQNPMLRIVIFVRNAVRRPSSTRKAAGNVTVAANSEC